MDTDNQLDPVPHQDDHNVSVDRVCLGSAGLSNTVQRYRISTTDPRPQSPPLSDVPQVQAAESNEEELDSLHASENVSVTAYFWGCLITPQPFRDEPIRLPPSPALPEIPAADLSLGLEEIIFPTNAEQVAPWHNPCAG
jgi:hypothetical protein